MNGYIPPVPEIEDIRDEIPETSSEVEVEKIVLAGCTIRWFYHWRHLCSAIGHCGTTITCGGKTSVGVSRTESLEIQSTLKVAALGIGSELGSKISSEYTESRQAEHNYAFSTPVPPCEKCRLAWWQLIKRVEISIPVSDFFGRKTIKVKQAVKALHFFDSFNLYVKDLRCPNPECHKPDLPGTRFYKVLGDGFSVVTPGVPVWTGEIALKSFEGLYKVGDTVPPELLKQYTASLSTSRPERQGWATLAEYRTEEMAKTSGPAKGSPLTMLEYLVLLAGTSLGFLIFARLRTGREGEQEATARNHTEDMVAKEGRRVVRKHQVKVEEAIRHAREHLMEDQQSKQ